MSQTKAYANCIDDGRHSIKHALNRSRQLSLLQPDQHVRRNAELLERQRAERVIWRAGEKSEPADRGLTTSNASTPSLSDSGTPGRNRIVVSA